MTMPPRKTSKAQKFVTLRMPSQQVDFLKRRAQQQESSLSGQIRLLVREAMEQERQAA